jgi:hypothetical protein
VIGRLWIWVLVGCIVLTLGMLMPDAGRATCGQKCDLSYSADIDGCRFQYGNDPADADALADCIQEAKDDHQSCLSDCANPAISPPSRWRLAGSTLVVRCFGPSRNRSSVDGLLTVSGAILPASAMGEHEQWKICPLGPCGLSRLPLGSAQGSPLSWLVRSAGPYGRTRRGLWGRSRCATKRPLQFR